MATLNYQMEIAFEPINPIPGQWVEATVRISDATGDIRTVYASVADYDFSMALHKTAENTFSTKFIVPWEADAGQYTVILWAVAPTGEAGPRINVPVTVKSN
jgi:hypothetical protein